MFLDEPTNNLDIESIDALCEAINVYNGGIILVSHDARLIEACKCVLWVVGDLNAKPFNGEFVKYRDHLLDEMKKKEAEIEAKLGVKSKSTKVDAPATKFGSAADLANLFA
jgi:ATP-binding cassette subfamily F protein 1